MKAGTKQLRAPCPICFKECAVREDGTIRRHDRERLHLPPQSPCIGSGRRVSVWSTRTPVRPAE